jgi:hypothetical protein
MPCNTSTLKKETTFSFLRNVMASRFWFVDKVLIIADNPVHNLGDNLGITISNTPTYPF